MKHVTQVVLGAVAVATGAMVLLGVGCAQWGTTGESAATIPPVAPAALADSGLTVRWQTEALLEPGTQLVALWVRGGYVVGLGSDQRVYVVDAETGVRRWSRVLAEPHETLWPPAVHRDDLWFATTTKLMGFRGADGENIVEEVMTPNTEAASANASDMTKTATGSDVVLVGATAAQRRTQAKIAVVERKRAAVDAALAHKKTDIELEFAPSGPPATDGVHMFIPDAKGWLQAVSIQARVVPWGRWTNDAVTAAPVVDASRVYFAGHDGIVYASTQSFRRVIWQYPTEGPVMADLRITDTGLVLVGSLDYSLYAFDGASGVLEWDQLPNQRYNAGEPIRKPPYTFGEQVFLFTNRAGLTVLDTTSGKTQWQLPSGHDLVTADADIVYVQSRGNDLLALDRKAGEVRFAIPLRAGTLAGINETGTGVLYLATPDGHILAAAKPAGGEEAEEEDEAAAK